MLNTFYIFNHLIALSEEIVVWTATNGWWCYYSESVSFPRTVAVWSDLLPTTPHMFSCSCCRVTTSHKGWAGQTSVSVPTAHITQPLISYTKGMQHISLMLVYLFTKFNQKEQTPEHFILLLLPPQVSTMFCVAHVCVTSCIMNKSMCTSVAWIPKWCNSS